MPVDAPDGTPATQTPIHLPYGLAIAPDDTLYFTDSANNRVVLEGVSASAMPNEETPSTIEVKNQFDGSDVLGSHNG